MTTITRQQLAAEIVTGLAAVDNLGGRLWTGGSKVRVYVVVDKGGRRGWIDNGFAEVNDDGTVTHNYTYQAGSVKDVVLAAIAGRVAEPVTRQVAVSSPVAIDEDVRQHEASRRTTYDSESTREIG